MPSKLPRSPNLRRLRDLARALQQDCRSGDAAGLGRLAAFFPQAVGSNVALSKALAVIAREYGYPNWPKLKTEVEAREATSAARKARRLAQVALLEARTDELARLSAQGDPVAIISLKPLGLREHLAVRDRIASQPEVWTRLVDVLVAGLSHSKPNVRFECAHALDTYDDGRAATALARLMDDPVPRVRWMAIHSLVCADCKVAPTMWAEDVCRRVAQLALTDASVRVRRHAVWDIVRCGAALATDTLSQVAAQETDSQTRRWAERGLKDLQRGAAPPA